VAALGSLWRGCQGLPKYIANCPVTPTAPSDISSIPEPIQPPPAALCGFPLTIFATLLRDSLFDDANGIVNIAREKEMIRKLANKLAREKESD
jgi:hypothetical protein